MALTPGLVVLTYVFWIAWLIEHRVGGATLAVPAAVLAYLAAVERWWPSAPRHPRIAASGVVLSFAGFAGTLALVPAERSAEPRGHCSP